MAKTYPSGWREFAVTGAARREIETLKVLEVELPDDYSVYHGVHWTRVDGNFTIFGELDFVVVSPSGHMLLIEQKSGSLEETDDGLVKLYLGKAKSVPSQIARAVTAMHGRLSAAFGAKSYRLTELLYCPDYQVKTVAIAGVDPAHIVDASKQKYLAAIIMGILPTNEAPLPCVARLHGFLSDELTLTPDAGANISSAASKVTRLSEGLATWARRITVTPFRMRVVGTAGSGKTQLAIRLLEDASKARQAALYVCFNRPLAEHIQKIAADTATVMTYHQLCEKAYRAHHTADAEGLDFARPDVFSTIEHHFVQYCVDQITSAKYDVVIIDEGQDFHQGWAACLQLLLRADGRIWWLEDPMQNLYNRPKVALPGWVQIDATANFRSPRDIVDSLRRLSIPPLPIEGASPFDESDVEYFTYSVSPTNKTIEAIDKALASGFRADDIAVLSYHGRDKSLFTHVGNLGPHRLRSFTGEYDASGVPCYREGDVLFDSVFRFKGQCAPCIILTEVDFTQFTETEYRRFFVGATRANLKLYIVISDVAAKILVKKLS